MINFSTCWCWFDSSLRATPGTSVSVAVVAISGGFNMGSVVVCFDDPFMVAVIRVSATKAADRVVFADYIEKNTWKRLADGCT